MKVVATQRVVTTSLNLTRRDFARLTALGLAVWSVPSLLARTAPTKKIGYCVIGLGRIAGHFMPAVRNTTTSQITGLVSGHRDKAEHFAAEYGVPSSSIYNYENFDQIAHNPAIDAVYVALPNSMHAEYSIRAAKAGGGPLFDVGIYSLNACRYLTGEEPEHISANASVIDHATLVVFRIC